MADITLLQGDCLELLKTLPEKSVQCCVTSPPYFALRDYGMDGQIGLEESPETYIEKLVQVFRGVRRVMRDDGTLWLNLGDSYAGSNGKGGCGPKSKKQLSNRGSYYVPVKAQTFEGIKAKDLIGIPWMVAFALRSDGWYLRQDIIWAKPNPMPESVTDRPTRSHEYIFLLTKSAKYYYDYEAILEVAAYDGRKDTKFRRSVKNYDLVVPGGKPQTFAQRGHERWSRKMPGIGQKHGEERGRGEEYKPMRGYKRKAQMETDSPQRHGLDIQSSYGLAGNGFKGHSGNYDSDGNLLGHDLNGIPARNKRDVWTVATKPYSEAHFATYPEKLIEPCILAGSRPGDTVLDPFNGSGTTGAVAIKYHRNYIGLELNPEYIELTKRRLARVQPVLMP